MAKAKTREMLHICMYCLEFLRWSREETDEIGISHGMCKVCGSRVLPMLDDDAALEAFEAEMDKVRAERMEVLRELVRVADEEGR